VDARYSAYVYDDILINELQAPEGIFDDGAASSNGTKPATVVPKPRNTPPKTTVVTSEDPLETAQTSEIVDPS
jgi:hypothetical protein